MTNKTQTNFGKQVQFEEGGGDEYDEDAEREAMVNRRIGPFSFDIDDEIDTEILPSQEVYDDLKELEKILDKGEDRMPT